MSLNEALRARREVGGFPDVAFAPIVLPKVGATPGILRKLKVVSGRDGHDFSHVWGVATFAVEVGEHRGRAPGRGDSEYPCGRARVPERVNSSSGNVEEATGRKLSDMPSRQNSTSPSRT